MGELAAANQKENTTTVRRQPKPEPTLPKTFAIDRHVVARSSGGRMGQAPAGHFLQRRCACGSHTVAGGPCSVCRRGLNGGLVHRTVDHGLLQEQGDGLPSRFSQDFSRVPIWSSESFPGRLPSPPAGSAYAGGRGVEAFLQAQIRERQAAGQAVQPAPTAEESPQGGREISRDTGQTLQRNGSIPGIAEAVAAARAAAAPTLTKNTLRGPTASNNGGYSWVIQWQLSKASTKGGWIVQRVNMSGTIKKADNSAVPTGWESHVPYWEAWQVRAGQRVTVFADGTVASDCEDDTYANPGYAASTQGQTEQTGSAQFYEGLTLPAAFTIIPGHPAGILRTTKSDPGLTGGSGAIAHNLTAAWNSIRGTGTTTITTA